jgi:hypothetical protein
MKQGAVLEVIRSHTATIGGHERLEKASLSTRSRYKLSDAVGHLCIGACLGVVRMGGKIRLAIGVFGWTTERR